MFRRFRNWMDWPIGLVVEFGENKFSENIAFDINQNVGVDNLSYIPRAHLQNYYKSYGGDITLYVSH